MPLSGLLSTCSRASSISSMDGRGGLLASVSVTRRDSDTVRRGLSLLSSINKSILSFFSNVHFILKLLQSFPKSLANRSNPVLHRLLTFGDVLSEAYVSLDYLVVAFKRNVAAHHVVEQDTERPDRRRHGMVPVATDPLRRTINPRTCKRINHLTLKNLLNLKVTQKTTLQLPLILHTVYYIC